MKFLDLCLNYYKTVANQLSHRIFRNSDFFQTHVHLGKLTFEKNYNHKNFLEKLDLRQSHYKWLMIDISILSQKSHK